MGCWKLTKFSVLSKLAISSATLGRWWSDPSIPGQSLWTFCHGSPAVASTAHLLCSEKITQFGAVGDARRQWHCLEVNFQGWTRGGGPAIVSLSLKSWPWLETHIPGLGHMFMWWSVRCSHQRKYRKTKLITLPGARDRRHGTWPHGEAPASVRRQKGLDGGQSPGHSLYGVSMGTAGQDEPSRTKESQ